MSGEDTNHGTKSRKIQLQNPLSLRDLVAKTTTKHNEKNHPPPHPNPIIHLHICPKYNKTTPFRGFIFG